MMFITGLFILAFNLTCFSLLMFIQLYYIILFIPILICFIYAIYVLVLCTALQSFMDMAYYKINVVIIFHQCRIYAPLNRIYIPEIRRLTNKRY